MFKFSLMDWFVNDSVIQPSNILQKHIPHRLKVSTVHLLLIWIVLYIGVILELPGDTFVTAQGYYYFKIIATETHWAYFFLSVAAIGVAGLQWSRLRVFSAHILSTAHLMLALLIGFSNPLSIVTGTYLGIACVGFAFLWTENINCYKSASKTESRNLGQYVTAAMYRHHRASLSPDIQNNA